MEKTYELVLILDSSVDEEKQKKLTSEVEKVISPGKVKEVQTLGKKVLSYNIKKEKEGIYLLLTLTMERGKASSLSRKLKLNDMVLRHLLLRKE